MAQQRTVKQITPPDGVKSKYLSMGHWTPRALRKKYNRPTGKKKR